MDQSIFSLLISLRCRISLLFWVMLRFIGNSLTLICFFFVNTNLFLLVLFCCALLPWRWILRFELLVFWKDRNESSHFLQWSFYSTTSIYLSAAEIAIVKFDTMLILSIHLSVMRFLHIQYCLILFRQFFVIIFFSAEFLMLLHLLGL